MNGRKQVVPSYHSFFIKPVGHCSRLITCARAIRVINVHFRPYKLFQFVSLPIRRLNNRQVDDTSLKVGLFSSSFARQLCRLPSLQDEVRYVRAMLIQSVRGRSMISGRVIFTMGRVRLCRNRQRVHLLTRSAYLYRQRLRQQFGLFAKFAPGRCDQVIGFERTVSLLGGAARTGGLLSMTIGTKCCSISRFLGRIGALSNNATRSFLSPALPRRKLLACVRGWGAN